MDDQEFDIDLVSKDRILILDDANIHSSLLAEYIANKIIDKCNVAAKVISAGVMPYDKGGFKDGRSDLVDNYGVLINNFTKWDSPHFLDIYNYMINKYEYSLMHISPRPLYFVDGYFEHVIIFNSKFTVAHFSLFVYKPFAYGKLHIIDLPQFQFDDNSSFYEFVEISIKDFFEKIYSVQLNNIV